MIVSPKNYNSKVGLALCMPIRSKIKGYPFKVVINEGSVRGAILSDQIRSLNWLSRKAVFIVQCDNDLLHVALVKLKLLIDQ